MKKVMTALCRVLLFVSIGVFLANCGGGGGGGSSGTGTTTGGGGGGGGGTTGPAFTGFNFALATGNFWEYKWDFSYAHAPGGPSLSDTGRFWVVLGQPVTIQGITAYEVKGYGKSIYFNKAANESRIFSPAWKYDSASSSFIPKWKYVAISNNKVLASADGVTLQTLFDAQLGMLKGGGFFTSFSDSLIVAQNGSINSANTYTSGSAVVVGRSSNQSLCETIAGEPVCTESYSQDFYEYEYYRPGVGPVGYYYSNNTYYPGPPTDIFNWKHNVGLIASSFTGQTYPLATGATSINFPSSALAITTSNPAIGNIWSPYVQNSNSLITVTVIDDNGNTVSPYQTHVENWYSFTLGSAKTVTITLSFEGAPANTDLDMFLMNSTATVLYGYSVHDNPVRQDQHEKITASLQAGTYRIGVDHVAPVAVFPSNSPTVTYTLVVE